LRKCIECIEELFLSSEIREVSRRKTLIEFLNTLFVQQGVLEQEVARRAPNFPLRRKRVESPKVQVLKLRKDSALVHRVTIEEQKSRNPLRSRQSSGGTTFPRTQARPKEN
jgi:hypothetical protein